MDTLGRVDERVDALQREVGLLLRGARQRRELTQAALAGMAGVSRPTVIAAEAGEGVSSRNLLALMAVLGLTVARQMAVTPSRPTLKALMHTERVRQAMLRAGPVAQALAEAADGGSRESRVLTGDEGRQQRPSRPTLKEVMAAERARMANVHGKALP